ncbi:MAG: SUMF1/EgtB/PvdO family nonheme iron enzyme [Rhodobacteraceae bacterium]|nr:SUMF1/EgtB/PvdO family nonheme iron enzyme [Paracoccaceae bacterium]
MDIGRHDFFISYTSADRGWAEWIAWQLEDAGYSTLIQAWDFHAGGNFILDMQRAAENSRRTIAVVSSAYLAALFTHPEWAAALAQDPAGTSGVLVPVRIEACQLTGLLRAVTHVDLVGLDEATAKRTLLARISGERLKPTRPPGFPGGATPVASFQPGFPGPPQALGDLHAALLAGQPVPEFDERTRQQIVRYSPRTIEDYRLARIAEWSQARYALDRRFTRLTLLIDQGTRPGQGTRWQAQPNSFDDLREVLAAAQEPALVLLGPPGCGKSTLLRRLELDLAVDALRAADPAQSWLSFFVPFNRYRPTRPGETLPAPADWLAQEWARRHPLLPALAELLQSGRLVLLLDAVNELPHADEDGYRERIAWWRDFLGEVPAGTRTLFSCRSLDYGAPLSTPEAPVTQVRIEPLGNPQVEEFLTLYDVNRGAALWRQLRGTPQLDLFRSPFYLRLLLAQAGGGGDSGPALSGKAALFTGFIRQALQREITADNPLFRPGALLDKNDHARIIRHEWRNPSELPVRGPLLPALCQLAFALQARRAPGETSRLRVPWDDALELLGDPHGASPLLLHAGVALQILEEQFGDVFFVHQLLQEYFAARALADRPQPALAASAWRAEQISPSLDELLAGLADCDPLPAAPTTGWEESFILAAAMAPAPADFVAALMAVNLPLAGRCAAPPDVILPAALRKDLQQALITRSRDPAADLRARIAAASALGELGDPRFTQHGGIYGDYLLPPLVDIAAGSYPIGSDEGLYEDESPAHEEKIAAFAIAQFPLTNAEWRLFVAAGAYDDERWWAGTAAQAWRRGEGTAEGPKQQWRQNRLWFQDDPRRIENLLSEGRIASKQAKDWQRLLLMSESEFEGQLDDWYPAGRQTQPDYWNDPAYNDPAQPVVGICWYEARAYCAWLSAQTGKRWRLPSESEREAAARGKGGRRYAWGDDFDAGACNTFEAHIRGTTPIGVFPGGDTPEGLVDISGNVWEWTDSVYRPYRPHRSDRRAADAGRDDAAPAETRRVLRGGSWSYGREHARCAARALAGPGNRGNFLGSRLLCVSPA